MDEEKKEEKKKVANNASSLCGLFLYLPMFHSVGVTATNNVNRHFHASGKEEGGARSFPVDSPQERDSREKKS